MNRKGTPLPPFLLIARAERDAEARAKERRRFCWVQPPNEATIYPALLVQWRRSGKEWVALVAYINADERLVVLTAPADALTPLYDP